MPVLRVIVVVALAIASAAAYDARLSERAYTYDEAAAHCRLLGRRLPVIETEEQMHLVEQHCSQLGKTSDCTWIALRCSTGAACGAANGWFWRGAEGLKTSALADSFVVNGTQSQGFKGGVDVLGHLPPAASANQHCMRLGAENSHGFNSWTPTNCAERQFALCEKPSGTLSVGSRLVLPTGFNKITAMAADDDFVFATTYTGQLLKVNQLNMHDFGVLNFADNAAGHRYNQLGALAVDATHAYATATLGTSIHRLLKINKLTMAVEDYYELTEADNIAFMLRERGDFVYAGLETSPGKVLKVSKETMKVVQMCQLGGGTGAVRSLEFDRVHSKILYAQTYAVPGVIAEIDTDTMTVERTKGFPNNYGAVLSGADQDSAHIVIGTSKAGLSAPAHIVQMRKSDFTQTANMQLDAGEEMVVALTSDNQFTYAALYTTPAKVVRLRNHDLISEQTVQIEGSSQATAMVTPPRTAGTSDKIYIGTDSSPAHVVEVVGVLRPIDCVMSDWGTWTVCDKTCGEGVHYRQRRVLHIAANGGKPCPTDTQQSRLCNVHVTCPRDCTNGMVWTTQGTLPRATCSNRAPAAAGSGIAMCACPPDHPYWHNHGFCVSESTCDVHEHSSICKHLQCSINNGLVDVSPIPGQRMKAEPFHCAQGGLDRGRIGTSCVCMCKSGEDVTLAPTPAPQPCYTNDASYNIAHMLGGLISSTGSATVCQSHCVSSPHCKTWSYEGATQSCFLYEAGAKLTKQTLGYISGPKVCPLDKLVATEFATAISA